MKRIGRVVGGMVLWIGMTVPGFAAEGGTTPEFLWVKEPEIATLGKAQIGFGLLDKGLNGSRGTVVSVLLDVDYAISPEVGATIGLPLAGTLSSGSDDFGIGNIVIGAVYSLRKEEALRINLGCDLALPTSQDRADVGTHYRYHVLYLDDQMAVSPYISLSWTRERLTLSADLGTDLQIFTETTPEIDTVENVLFYDLGAAMSVSPNIWATVEFGGYSTLTYEEQETALYAGPGARYQDHQISMGLHLWAPFRKPARDIVDFMAVFDVRVPF